MFFTTHDNLKIYYEFKGNINSPRKIILLNGLTQTTIAWELCIQKLLPSFHVILMDFIFQGRSDEAPQHRSFDVHAQDVFGFISTVVKQPIAVAGISYGSLVAQHLAVNYPQVVNKLMLISSFAHKTPLYRSVELSWKNALKIGGYDLLLDVMMPYVLGQSYFESPFIPIEKMKTLRKDLQPKPESILKLMQATEERADYLNALKQITCPVWIIHGQNDILFPVYYAKAIQESISQSQLHIYEHCGHTINLEKPEQLAQDMITFCS